MAFASKTKVPVDRSQAEIRKILMKHGATAFGFAEKGNIHILTFELHNRRMLFRLPVLPQPTKGERNFAAKEAHVEQFTRSRWRALVLAVKAKLECVEAGITSIEQEFLAHIVLPNGSTVMDEINGQLDAAYRDAKMPPLLGYGG